MFQHSDVDMLGRHIMPDPYTFPVAWSTSHRADDLTILDPQQQITLKPSAGLKWPEVSGFTHNCFCTQVSWQNVHGDVSAFRCRHVGSTYHAWPLYVPSGVEYQSSGRRPDHPWSSATNYPQALSWFEMTRGLSCLVWMECSPNAHKGNILVPVDQGHAGYQYIYPV